MMDGMDHERTHAGLDGVVLGRGCGGDGWSRHGHGYCDRGECQHGGRSDGAKQMSGFHVFFSWSFD